MTEQTLLVQLREKATVDETALLVQLERFKGEKGDKGDSGGTDAFTTPEQYGAVGDGETDDAPALQAALESGKPVMLTRDLTLKSKIWVRNHDIVLDGNGYTLYADGAALPHDAADSFILFSSDMVEDESADCCMVSENETIYPAGNIGTGYIGAYKRGYISYKGRNPTPDEEAYEDCTRTYWDAHSAHIRHVRIRARNAACMHILELRRMCHSTLTGVSVICEEGHDAAVGIIAYACHDVHIAYCYAENFFSATTAHISDEGYGIQTAGDMITVDHCVLCNNKHNFCAGGSRDFFDTNLIVSDMMLYRAFTDEKRSDGSAKHMHSFDIHAACHNATVSNLQIISENSPVGLWQIQTRCPQVTMSHVTVTADGGVITCGELSKTVRYEDLRAENCAVRTQTGKPIALERFEVNGGQIWRVLDSLNAGQLILRNVIIDQLVEETRGLRMEGCTILRNMDWPSKPTLTLNGETLLRDCILYGHKETSISKQNVIIKAAANSVRMIDCQIYKRNGDQYRIFSTEQPELQGCSIENVFGLKLDTDASVLGTNELY